MRHRAALAAVALLLATGCSSADGTDVAATAPGQVAGFRVVVDDEQEPAPGPAGAGQLAWESTWQLSWEQAPGVTSYALYYATNEGRGAAEPTVQREPVLRLQAAAGTSPVAEVPRARQAALLFTSSQLLVSVSARTEAGEGPRSPWFAVGDAPASGVPIGTVGSEPVAGH